MRISALLLPFLIAAATIAACSWFSRKDARADARAALAQRTPETAPALSYAERFNWSSVRQAREKATGEDKQYATDVYNYVLESYGPMGDPQAIDTLILSLQRYPSPEIYLLLGYQNETYNMVELNYQWFKQFGTDWWEKSKPTQAQDSTRFFAKYGADGTAIEYFEMAGHLGLSEGWYRAAALYARQGEASLAAERLNTAIDSGFSDVPRFLNDTTFDIARNLPPFIAVQNRMQQKFGELSAFFRKFREEFTALALPLQLDSTLKQGSVFNDDFEAFVPEVTTEKELKLFGAMERYGPPTYRYVGSVQDANRPYDLLIIEASSADMGTSRYLHFATFDKEGRRISFHPIMLYNDYRDSDRSYGYSVIRMDNNFVIEVETHQFEPENYETEDAPLRETVETLKLTLDRDGKLVADKSATEKA